MRVSLIITTYNRPRVLSLVLQTVRNQSVLPDEVIIADDGSKEETELLVSEIARTFPVPLIHSWQEDAGFRAARSRNLAASRSTGDYLIFLDGDALVHPKFVESHVRFAKRGRLLFSGRAMLNVAITERIVTTEELPGALTRLLRSRNRHNLLHSTLLARMLLRVTAPGDKIKSCNMSVFRDDMLRINGFNEDFVFWGQEDDEFGWRFHKAGGELVRARFCAVQYHLDHGRDNKINRTRKQRDHNLMILRKTIESPGYRCANGIDKHLPILVHESNGHDK